MAVTARSEKQARTRIQVLAPRRARVRTRGSRGCDRRRPARQLVVTHVSRRDTMVDFKLEVVVIPVADVDRAKAFYAGLGWRLDADFSFGNGVSIVQFTPPGSPASIQFGARLTSAAPGSAENLYLIVSDIQAARDALVARGVDVSEVFHPG